MRDIRLEEVPFEFDGKTYLLRCNMNVLADVSKAYGGSIGGAMDGRDGFRSVLEFLAAMLNDYADEQGWPERYTAREVGRKFRSFRELQALDVMGLVTRALVPPDEEKAEPVSGPDTESPEPEDRGN